MATIKLHGVQNGPGLEASRFQSRTSDVPPLGELGDTEYSALSIVNPVRSEQTTEGCHKDTSTVVFHRRCQVTNLVRVRDEAHVVHEELDTTACDRDTALKGIHGFPLSAKVVCDGCQKSVRRNDRLFAHVVQQEATSTVRVLGRAGRKPLLTDQS